MKILRWVTVAGWLAWAAAVVSLSVGFSLGWREFVVLGVVFVLLCLTGLFALRASVHLTARFPRPVLRALPGDSVSVTMDVTTTGSRSVGSSDLDVTVGNRVRTRRLPRLRPGTVTALEWTVEAPSRMVIPLGPVSVVRRDPFGLYERRVRLTASAKVVVHPVTVTLPPLSAGFVRDLEGEASRDLTDADLSFHALREYAAGDDRRHIHWKSSAKTGRLMVRQYEQTRRSRVLVVCDTSADSYLDDQEFELAVSVAASLGVRALRDSRDIGFEVARSGLTHPGTVSPKASLQSFDAVIRLSGASGPRLLDDVAALTRSASGFRLADVTTASALAATDVSIVFVVTGSCLGVNDLQHVSVPYGPGVEVVVLRCSTEASPALRSSGRLTIGTIGRLDDLSKLLARERVSS